MNTTKSGRSISAVAYDDNGNKISKEVSAGSTICGCIIVDGEYARGAVENTLNDDIRYEFSPIYDNSTGSVLS